MPRFRLLLLTLPLLALNLGGCQERAKPAHAREASPATDTTGTATGVQQQSVPNTVSAGAAPGPGPTQ